jgi:hypothetical protein
MIVVKAAEPRDSHRGTGWDPSCPEESRVKKTGEYLLSINANDLFRIVGLSKPRLPPML